MGNAIRWTSAELAAYQARTHGAVGVPATASAAAPAAPVPPKRNKFGNKKVKQDGSTFDSSKEARRWLQLEQLQRAGVISELKRQVGFVLAPPVRLAGEKRQKPALRYFADAVYVQDGQLVVEDTKSTPTRTKEAYRIKKHLMKSVHGLDIKEI